jgi:beta-mannosidase
MFVQFLAIGILAAGPEVIHLGSDGNLAQWALSNRNGTIAAVKARVPGCVHTDLLAAGLIGEPNFGTNAQLQRWIASDNFTYTTSFAAPSSLLAKQTVDLELAGLDTAVAVSLNEKTVLSAANMHRTFMVDVTELIRANNTLTVRFTGPVPASLSAQAACAAEHGALCANAACICPVPWAGPAPKPMSLLINAYIRKEQQSFSWDFAPPSGTSGITLEPLLVGYEFALLRDVVVDTQPIGDAHSSWTVTIAVRIWSSHGPQPGDPPLTLSVAFADLNVSASTPIKFTTGETTKTIKLTIPPTVGVERWWPNGYGGQKTYPLAVTLQAQAKVKQLQQEASNETNEVQTKTVNVGFRTVALEQPPLPTGHGDGHLYQYRVNGQVIHAR